MPGLPDTMYCSQQIHIPPMFPYILRQYAKAAIKTQPTDLLRWSSAYFRALSLNLEVPSKKRLEYPEPKSFVGLTPGFIKVLLKQIGKDPTQSVKYVDLLQKWEGICLKEDDLILVLLTCRFQNAEKIDWLKFIAVCAGLLSENLTNTMLLICNLLTEEPDGGNAMIPVDMFLQLYKYLAGLDCSGTRYVVNTFFFRGKVAPKRALPSEPTSESIGESVQISIGAPPQTDSHNSNESAMPAEFEHLAATIGTNLETFLHKIEVENLLKGVEAGQFDIDLEFNIKVQDSQAAVPEEVSSQGEEGSQMETLSNVESVETEIKSTIEEEMFPETETDIKSSAEENISEDNDPKKEEVSMEEETVEEVGEETEPLKSDSKDSSKLTIDDLLTHPIPGSNFAPDLQDSHVSSQETLLIQPVVTHTQPAAEPTFTGSTYSRLLGKISAHLHLNKYLRSDGGTSSMMTGIVSRFTTAEVPSDTKTIYRETDNLPVEKVFCETELVRYEIEEVPGIGPVVDKNTMDYFIQFIMERAANQQGMVMPRNITNFQCPPLENFNAKKCKEEKTIEFEGCGNVF